MMSNSHLVVSGNEWEKRFAAYHRYAILTNRGFLMQGSEAKIYHSFEGIDLKPGQQIVRLPTDVATDGRI